MTSSRIRSLRGPRWAAGLAALLALTGCGGEGMIPSPANGRGADVPSSVDLRPFFAEHRLSIRKQGDRPTCSSFTVTGALEYAWARRTGKGERLSVEFVNWAADETSGDEEDGSYFSDLWNGYAVHGICAEADEPYREAYDPGRPPTEDVLARAHARRDAGLRRHWIKEWNVETGLTDDELAGVRGTLSDGWPVCGGFRWPKEPRWIDGVLQMAPPEGVFDGHSVLLVGYRKDATLPGGGAFLLHDSGAEPRGDAMSFEYARRYMNDAMWIDAGE